MKDIKFVTVSERRCEGRLPKRTNPEFGRSKKAKAGMQPERVREFEAGRAKLNESDVGLQDRCPKPTGAKRRKPECSPKGLITRKKPEPK